MLTLLLYFIFYIIAKTCQGARLFRWLFRDRKSLLPCRSDVVSRGDWRDTASLDGLELGAGYFVHGEVQFNIGGVVGV